MAERQLMAQGAVTFLDVLGWGGIWSRDKPDDAVNRLRGLLKLAKDVVARRAITDPDPESRGTRTEIKSISDTIVLQTVGEPSFTPALHNLTV